MTFQGLIKGKTFSLNIAAKVIPKLRTTPVLSGNKYWKHLHKEKGELKYKLRVFYLRYMPMLMDFPTLPLVTSTTKTHPPSI